MTSADRCPERHTITTSPSAGTSASRSGSSLTVDTNGTSVVDLALALHAISPSALDGIKLPSYAEYLGGISYVLPYQDQAAALYRAIVDDTLDTWVTANQMWVNHL